MGLKRIPLPVQVDLNSGGVHIDVTWQDGRILRYRAFDLRAQCPCAECVDELTGVRKLRPEQVAPEIAAREVGRVGRYALRFQWSDGHNTGIYTYERLLDGYPAEPRG